MSGAVPKTVSRLLPAGMWARIGKDKEFTRNSGACDLKQRLSIHWGLYIFYAAVARGNKDQDGNQEKCFAMMMGKRDFCSEDENCVSEFSGGSFSCSNGC